MESTKSNKVLQEYEALRLSEQKSTVMAVCVCIESSGEVLNVNTSVEGELVEWSEDMIPFQFDSSGRSIDDVKECELPIDLIR